MAPCKSVLIRKGKKNKNCSVTSIIIFILHIHGTNVHIVNSNAIYIYIYIYNSCVIETTYPSPPPPIYRERWVSYRLKYTKIKIAMKSLFIRYSYQSDMKMFWILSIKFIQKKSTWALTKASRRHRNILQAFPVVSFFKLVNVTVTLTFSLVLLGVLLVSRLVVPYTSNSGVRIRTNRVMVLSCCHHHLWNHPSFFRILNNSPIGK